MNITTKALRALRNTKNNSKLKIQNSKFPYAYCGEKKANHQVNVNSPATAATSGRHKLERRRLPCILPYTSL